jgi:sterol desaturase/sphingolipid hydroxylase (fatty acid hydroxylase superfamily)
MVDIKLFLVGRLLDWVGAFNMIAIRTAVAVGAMGSLQMATGTEALTVPWTAGRAIAVTVVFTLVSDFCVYWVHRWHHEQPVLWPFHAVHHSAEVLTPITVYRKHPIYDLISDGVSSVFIGFAQGVFLFLLFNDLSPVTIGGANAAYVLFNLFGSNLRHSHVWIGYGPVLSHILISPAQHQIHHSRDPRHHDKNYGEIFAIWDWMFGTLYVPRTREVLEFGLADSAGNPVEQPHPSLRAALVRPFVDSRKALARMWRPRDKRSAGRQRAPS